MLPILLVYKDQKKVKKYIKDLQKKENIKEEFVFKIEPEKKHFSINQIKLIQKNLIYKINEPRLYILFDFDTATYDAQNAFLKTLEEHDEFVHFVLVVSQYYNLAPTLISRSKIVLDSQIVLKKSEEIESKLDEFIKNKNLQILGDKLFQAKGKKSPLEIIDNMIMYFNNRLTKDPKTTNVLREIIEYRSYVVYNNVDTQIAIDHILIYIYKKYKEKS